MFEVLGETQIFIRLMALSGDPQVPQAELFNFTHLISSRDTE